MIGRLARELTTAVVLVLALTCPGLAQEADLASPAAPPTGTAFTYQGQLTGSGGPADGPCDLQASLWNAAGSGSPPSGGTQLGSTQTVTGVPVSAGLFTVQLNGSGEFGETAFGGGTRWLQIAVKCPADAGFVTLAPRQALAATPFSHFASRADAAASAPWSGLAGIPAASGDLSGTYPNLSVRGLRGRLVASTAPTPGQVLKWIGTRYHTLSTLLWGHAREVVRAGGGDPESVRGITLLAVVPSSQPNLELERRALGIGRSRAQEAAGGGPIGFGEGRWQWGLGRGQTPELPRGRRGGWARRRPRVGERAAWPDLRATWEPS